MEKLLEEMVDEYYGKQAPETPSWTLKQVVEARRAMVEAIKKHGYLPIANLWMGPLITKEIFEPQIPKSLTP
jgi:2,4-dienoyl-CoA reductase-like NADH-dependent reductase (Old Yellow Enzyme family)